MCKYHPGSFYEPPSYEECQPVFDKADAYAREKGFENLSAIDDKKILGAILADASEDVHGKEML